MTGVALFQRLEVDGQARGGQTGVDAVHAHEERHPGHGRISQQHVGKFFLAPGHGRKRGILREFRDALDDARVLRGEKALGHQRVHGHAQQQGAHGHGQGQRPEQAPFAGIAHDAAGTGQHVEKMVGGADAGAGVAQKAHLERQEQEGSRQAAHGRDERDAHGRQDGHQGVTLDTGNGKEHGPPPQVVRRGKSRVN